CLDACLRRGDAPAAARDGEQREQARDAGPSHKGILAARTPPVMFGAGGCAKPPVISTERRKPCLMPSMPLQMHGMNARPLGLSTSQAARELGVSLGTVRRWSDM